LCSDPTSPDRESEPDLHIHRENSNLGLGIRQISCHTTGTYQHST
jgi:hypothetical protein